MAQEHRGRGDTAVPTLGTRVGHVAEAAARGTGGAVSTTVAAALERLTSVQESHVRQRVAQLRERPATAATLAAAAVLLGRLLLRRRAPERQPKSALAPRRAQDAAPSSSRQPVKPTTDAADAEAPGIGLLDKMGLAWQLFFPGSPEGDTGSPDAQRSLRLVLVADRLALSTETLSDMREALIGTLSSFVVVDEDREVDKRVEKHDARGTMFSVSVPVQRLAAARP